MSSLFEARPITPADVPAVAYAIYQRREKRRADGSVRVVWYRVSDVHHTLSAAALDWNGAGDLVVAPWIPCEPFDEAQIVNGKTLSDVLAQEKRRIADENERKRQGVQL